MKKLLIILTLLSSIPQLVFAQQSFPSNVEQYLEELNNANEPYIFSSQIIPAQMSRADFQDLLNSKDEEDDPLFWTDLTEESVETLIGLFIERYSEGQAGESAFNGLMEALLKAREDGLIIAAYHGQTYYSVWTSQYNDHYYLFVLSNENKSILLELPHYE